jgi:hypothetical protein
MDKLPQRVRRDPADCAWATGPLVGAGAARVRLPVARPAAVPPFVRPTPESSAAQLGLAAAAARAAAVRAQAAVSEVRLQRERLLAELRLSPAAGHNVAIGA